MAEQQEEMSFLQHLEVLRWHLIRSVLAIIVLGFVAFFNKEILFDVIIFGPKDKDFWTFQVLCKLSNYLSTIVPSLINADTLCVGQDMPPLQSIVMSGQFTTHIMVSIVAGFILAFPYAFWEIWRFIRPALSEMEQKTSRGIVFFTWVLFIAGVLFGYYLIAPLSVNFFVTYSISDEVQNIFTLGTYISTVTTIVLASGVVFELPILIYFLSKVGLISPQFLRNYRRHSIVVIFILSAVITPPDVFSQLLVSIPLLVLYEISIFISAWVMRSNEKRLQAS